VTDQDQRGREDQVANLISILLKYQLGQGHKPELQREISRVIDRLSICNGQYWRLSERDDAIVDAAIRYTGPIWARRSRPELINEKRRTYGGTIVSDDVGQMDDYFRELRGSGRGRPADLARVERVAQEIAAIKREGQSIWRAPKEAAGKFKKPLPGKVLTGGARARLSEAYANGGDHAAISKKDLRKAVEKAEKIADILMRG